MRRRFVLGLAVLVLLRPAAAFARPELPKSVSTKTAAIHYADDAELSDFFWRITGERDVFIQSPDLAKNRLDELIDRVEAILDMHPDAFHVDIELKPRYDGGEIAFYSYDDKTIVVSVDRVTDGVLAHEVAHALINASIHPAPPEKTQEILSRYVDEHLWEETA